MSTITDIFSSASARDSAKPAGSNTGLVIFRSDTNAVEISDGSAYQTYNSDGVGVSFQSNTKSGEFDGVGDYVDVGNHTSLNVTGALSITAWVKFDSLSGFPMILSKRASGGHAYQFYSTNNKLNYNNGTISQSTGTISTGSWTHVGVTFDGAGGVTFYINGSAAGTGTSASTNPTNSENVTFGKAYNGNYMDGKMDEIGFFNSELTATQIANIYTHKFYSAPVSVWRFEDDVTDSVGSNDGSNNGVTFSTDKPY